ncbi:hypothetical protein GXN76_00790 [Kroppenstedtia pulmonis]|uniref:Uncharacterized protein n=1 Tax=Kroppenstedtia pulmonis TaxID=1380685 RepID=A0A7D4CJN7_9BACL|nr:hypothetical protein [Kroppenstedtia pulmonis]QKG83138.1 hypothetical protein GXN76_00790 [Kroppenstedtia pulmonis]
MAEKLPIYLDNEETKLDWEAHRAIPIEERIDAIRPFVTGDHIEEKLQKIEKDAFSKDQNDRTGAIGELEFLERKAFQEKVKILILEDNRDILWSHNPEDKVKNPDFQVQKEIIELKTLGDFSKGFNDQVKRAIKHANKQIKMSDYKTPSSFDGYPQGQVEIQLVGKELPFQYKDLFKQIEKEFTPGQFRSLKQVSVFHEHQLVAQYVRDNERNRIIQTFPPEKEREQAIEKSPSLNSPKEKQSLLQEISEERKTIIDSIHWKGLERS